MISFSSLVCLFWIVSIQYPPVTKSTLAVARDVHVQEHENVDSTPSLLLQEWNGSNFRPLALIQDYEPSGHGVNADWYGPFLVVDYLVAGNVWCSYHVFKRQTTLNKTSVMLGPLGSRPKEFRGGLLLVGFSNNIRTGQVTEQPELTYFQVNKGISRFQIPGDFESTVVAGDRCYARYFLKGELHCVEIFKRPK